MAGVTNARRTPKPATFYRVVQRISDRFEPRVRRGILRALDRLRDRIDLAVLRGAVSAGDLASMRAAVLGDDFGTLLLATGVEGGLIDAATAAGRANAEILAGATGLSFAFRDVDPAATIFARDHVGKLIVAVSEDVRESVRIVTALGQRFGLTVDQQARAIREVVGLPPNWAAAPARFADELRRAAAGEATGWDRRRLSGVDKSRIRKRLRDGTLTESFIAELEETYAQRLVNLRARTIARTETIRAANYGQRLAWSQAQKEEVLPSTARRVWIVTPDDRLRYTHAQVPGMNPDGVEIDGGVYRTPVGDSRGPPLEPNCRCSEGLIFPSLTTAAPPAPPEPPRGAPEAKTVRVPTPTPPAPRAPPVPRSEDRRVPAVGARTLESMFASMGRLTKTQRASIERGVSSVLGDFPELVVDSLGITARLKGANGVLETSYHAGTGEILRTRMKFRRAFVDNALAEQAQNAEAWKRLVERGHTSSHQWSVSSTASDPIMTTAAHEAGHALQNLGFGNLPEAKRRWRVLLAKRGVPKADHYLVSEYAALNAEELNAEELFAEAVAAIATGRSAELPQSILDAVEEFIDEIRNAVAARSAP